MQVEARRDRKDVTSDPANNRRHDAAYRESGDDRACGNGQDLKHVDPENRSAVGACHFQRGNACALAGEVAADAITDADAGNDQGGKANERQKLAHTFNKTPRSRRAV